MPMSPSQTMSRQERRRFQRVDLDLPAVVRLVGSELSATLRSISRTGAVVELGRAAAMPVSGWVVLAGAGRELRGCDAKVIEADGARWRLAFDPALAAMDLLGVAKLLR
jgi:hypothetical protein